MKHCLDGWPERHTIEPALKPYWKVQGELSVHNNLFLFQKRIVVPGFLQQETLRKLHHGHQSIQRCQLKARISVWWPGILQRIKEVIEGCAECVKRSTPRPEPLMPTPLPDYPWQSVAMDLFMLNGANYVLIVDYFSRYPEVIKLKSTSSKAVIEAVEAVFSRHGIPETVRIDNGPQFSSDEFARSAADYGFRHTTNSPHFPQRNGLAERTVQTVKNILKGNQDPYLAILTYRSTQLPWCGLSPAQLLMGRQLRTNLPQISEQLKPTWTHLHGFQEQDQEFKSHQKANFDKHHRVHSLPQIPQQTEVWITTDRSKPTPGVVVGKAEAPRSYIVETLSGKARRNQHQLNVMPSLDGKILEPPGPELEQALPESHHQHRHLPVQHHLRHVQHHLRHVQHHLRHVQHHLCHVQHHLRHVQHHLRHVQHHLRHVQHHLRHVQHHLRHIQDKAKMADDEDEVEVDEEIEDEVEEDEEIEDEVEEDEEVEDEVEEDEVEEDEMEEDEEIEDEVEVDEVEEDEVEEDEEIEDEVEEDEEIEDEVEEDEVEEDEVEEDEEIEDEEIEDEVEEDEVEEDEVEEDKVEEDEEIEGEVEVDKEIEEEV
eukprot:Em0009g171a